MNTNDIEYKTREDAYLAILGLRHEYGDKQLSHANEAQTRLLVINKVLNILGWKDTDFNPEKPAGGIGYTDYLLSIDKEPKLVVEAKRSSHTFRATQNFNKSQYTLKYLRTAYGTTGLGEVIDQAEKYVVQNGLSFAVITNGAEWILLQLRLAPGFKHLDDLQCFYFGSLFSEDFEFNLLWELLHKDYVEEGQLEEQFSHLNDKEAEFVGTPHYDVGDLRWNKIDESRTLRDFYFYFFDQMNDQRRRQMLEQCFVSNPRLDQYQGELSRSLKDTVPAYIQNATELEPDGLSEIFSTDTGDKKGNVILIAGSVGCGKSTFVSKVLQKAKAEARAEQSRSQVFLLVDLIDEVVYENDNTISRLWQKIKDNWHDQELESTEYGMLRKIFGRELQILRNGANFKLFENDKERYQIEEANELSRLSSDPERFMLACWKYYREKHHTGIVVFFDNVDRGSENYQKIVYGLAHKIANETGASVIITMRESTYFRGRDGGFLDVRTSDTVYHLQAPNLEAVLSRRIRYIEDSIDDDIRVSAWKHKDWPSIRKQFLNHAHKLKEVFLIGNAGRDKLSILNSIAWHDVRYFLLMLRELHTHLGSEHSNWSLPELISVLMTPIDIEDSVSTIPNVYQPSFSNYKCYYLKLRIILLLTYGVKTHDAQRGVSLNKILKITRLYGYQRKWSERAIEELVKTRLLECLEIPTEREFTKGYVLSAGHTFRRSPLAVALIDQIVAEPIYLSLVGNDLPFHTQSSLAEYTKAMMEVVSTLESGKLEPVAVELITDNSLGVVVAHYLLNAFEDERVADYLLRNEDEIASTERKLDEILKRIERHSGSASSVPTTPSNGNMGPLFNLDVGEDERTIIERVPIPKNIHNIRIGKSYLAPLAFWALVALTSQGHNSNSPSTITKYINKYLLDENDKKNLPSITRTLKLMSGTWIVPIGSKYQLSQDWSQHWEQIFGEPPPLINISS